MLIDLPPPHVAALASPQRIERRKRGRSAAIVLGSILILSDGSQCVVVGFDVQGRPLCAPAP